MLGKKIGLQWYFGTEISNWCMLQLPVAPQIFLVAGITSFYKRMQILEQVNKRCETTMLTNGGQRRLVKL